MRRLILATVVLVLSAAVADAGPLGLFGQEARDRRAARRGGCQSCPQQSVQTGGVSYTLGGGCANGSCPVPQAVPGQALPVAVPGK